MGSLTPKANRLGGVNSSQPPEYSREHLQLRQDYIQLWMGEWIVSAEGPMAPVL